MHRRAALLSLAACTLPASALAAPRAQAPEPRILGTWRSDRERTLAFWAAGRLLTDAQRAAMAQTFGQMVHVITPTTFTMIPQAGVAPIRSRYRVAARTGSSVTLLHAGGFTHTLYLTETGYFLRSDDFIEYFRREAAPMAP